MTDVNDFLTGSGAPSISWKDATPGTVITGKVVTSEVTQQRDMDGNPKTWDDGNPMKQLVITLHNPDWADGDNPDGSRRLFAKGSRKPESKSMLAAVIEALRKADAKLEPGGTLTVRYLGEGEQTKRGFAAPKQYAAKYEKPAFDPDEEEPW
jgi:hypothetical protein